MRPRNGSAPNSETARGNGPNRETQADNANTAAPAHATQGSDGPFGNRRRFLIWAAMAGFVGPERVTERILADLDESGGGRQ
jgi:hypothetical protein